MQIQVNDLQYTTGPFSQGGIRNILLGMGFGLQEFGKLHEGEVVESARIWTEQGEEGPQGFEVGMVRRDFGHFPRYTLTLDDARIGRARLGELLLTILEENVRA